MLDAICREIKNYFSNEEDRFVGDYAIIDGKITPPIAIQEGQYYRIVKSAFNDDVYIAGQEALKDENTFHGAIWLMKPPKEFLALVNDIEDWQEKYGNVNSIAMSPYTSENFVTYGYSKSTSGGGSTDAQNGLTWQSAFADRLAPYRRVRIL